MSDVHKDGTLPNAGDLVSWLSRPIKVSKFMGEFMGEFASEYQQERPPAYGELPDWLCVELVKALLGSDWRKDRPPSMNTSLRALHRTVEYTVHSIIKGLAGMTEGQASHYLDRIQQQSPILYALVRYSQDRVNDTTMRRYKEQQAQLERLKALRAELGLRDGQPVPTAADVHAEAERRRLEAEQEAHRLAAAQRVDVAEARRLQSRRVQVDPAVPAEGASDSGAAGQQAGGPG